MTIDWLADDEEDPGPAPALLKGVPQEGWRDVLRPLTDLERKWAITHLPPEADTWAALALVAELDLEDGARRHAARTVHAPLLQGTPPPRAPSRQLNFRIGPEGYERLGEAARLFGVRPTTLARMLVTRGVDAALREAAAA